MGVRANRVLKKLQGSTPFNNKSAPKGPSAFANIKTRALEKDELNKKAEENDRQNKGKYKGKIGRSNEFEINDMVLAKNSNGVTQISSGM